MNEASPVLFCYPLRDTLALSVIAFFKQTLQTFDLGVFCLAITVLIIEIKWK